MSILRLTNMRFASSSILNPFTSLDFGAWYTYPLAPKPLRHRPDTLSPTAYATVILFVLFFLCSAVFLFIFQHLEGEPAPKAGVKAGIQTGSINSLTAPGPSSEISAASGLPSELLRLSPHGHGYPPGDLDFSPDFRSNSAPRQPHVH